MNALYSVRLHEVSTWRPGFMLNNFTDVSVACSAYKVSHLHACERVWLGLEYNGESIVD